MQNRFKSKALWVSVFGAVWIILEAFGLPAMWGIEKGTVVNVFDAIASILIAFGILNNPTDPENL